MSPFKARLKRQWQFHLLLLRSVADWTTYVYICIPAVLFCYFCYRETILKQSYGIFEVIPLPLLVFLLFLCVKVGPIRTFIEAADRLFFIQDNTKMKQLKIVGLLYSVGKQLLLIGFVIGLLTPVLFGHYQITAGQLFQLDVALLTSYVAVSCIHYMNGLQWLKYLGQFGVVVLLTIGFLKFSVVLMCILCVTALIIFIFYYFKEFIVSNHQFDQQLHTERAVFFKWQSAIFNVSQELRSLNKPELKKNKPWLFNSEQRLFNKPGYEIPELIVKTLLRNRQYGFAYIRLIAVTLPFFVFLPWWGSVILLIITYFMLSSWLTSVMVEIQGHPVFTIYQTTEQSWLVAHKKIKLWFVNYVLLLLCIFVAIITLI